MLTQIEENYLKSIFHLSQESEKVNTNAIAAEVSTTAASVTDMLKRLAEKKLINYVKYKGVSLTNSGKDSAIKTIRKHRLWEFFLVEKLKFKWDEVHEVAEQLEHVDSNELTERLANFLGNPEYDPHGDPIPDKDGNFSHLPKVALSKTVQGTIGNLIGVKNDSSSFLKYLNNVGLQIGKKIEVKLVHDFDGSCEIILDNKTINLSKQVADNIFISQT